MVPDLKLLQFSLEALVAVGETDGFKGAWPALSRMTEARLTALEARAATQAADAAARIEGLLPNPGMQERYMAALAIALQSAEKIGESLLIALHARMMGDVADAGVFKTEPDAVEAFDADGKSLGAIFATERPEAVAARLTELTTWIETALEDPAVHPLAAIAVFLALFLEIHPFRSGTTRLSSILVTMLLVRAGYDYARYSSLDNAIEAGKYSYYLALRRTLATLRSPQPDWRHWLDFFFRALRQQTRGLREQIATDRAVADDLPELSAQILAIARQRGRVTIAAAAQATGISRNTIKDHVSRLAEQGHLVPHGAGRGAWYGLR
jgi:Fic family protein